MKKKLPAITRVRTRAAAFALSAVTLAASALASPVTAIVGGEKIRAIPEAALYAADKSADLERAIISVKGVFEIDEKIYTRFETHYNSNFTLPDGTTVTIWRLNWQSEDYNYYINATVTSNGDITSFSKRSPSVDDYGFAAISADEAIAAADAVIRDLFPDDYQKFSGSVSSMPNPAQNYYNVGYSMTINGYDMPEFNSYISVNKYTGEIINYNSDYIYYNNLIFPIPETQISETAAADAFADYIGLELQYIGRYDYTLRTRTIFPAYVYSGYNKYIDAKTGKLLIPNMSNKSVGDTAEAAGEGGFYRSVYDPNGILSPVEQAAVDKIAAFISEQEAIDALITAAGVNFGESGYTQNVSLYKDRYGNGSHYYQISLRSNDTIDASGKEPYVKYDPSVYQLTGVYGMVDAETGLIYSYNINDNAYDYAGYYERINTDGNEINPAYTSDQARAIAEEKIRSLAPEQFGQTEQNGEHYNGSNYYYFNYNRVVNGIPYYDNGINVTFSTITGMVTSYSLNWYDADFPSVKDAITPEQASAALLEANGFDKYYIMSTPGNAALVYGIKTVKSYFIDPFTGDLLNYDGSVCIDIENPDYSDVIGHWSEEIVTKLFNNGITYWDGSFNPDAPITADEFLGFLQRGLGYRMPELYRINTSAGNVSADIATPSQTSSDSSAASAERSSVDMVAREIPAIAADTPAGEGYSSVKPYEGGVIESGDDAYMGIMPISGGTVTAVPIMVKLSLTRAEAAEIIVKALGYGQIGALGDIFIYPFGDNVDPAYRGYIAICNALGIIDGIDGSFDSEAAVTRADAAVMLYNLIEYNISNTVK